MKNMESSWTGLRLESTPLQNGAGEANLKYGSFPSFRRKPESSSIKDEIRCLHNYDLISNFRTVSPACLTIRPATCTILHRNVAILCLIQQYPKKRMPVLRMASSQKALEQTQDELTMATGLRKSGIEDFKFRDLSHTFASNLDPTCGFVVRSAISPLEDLAVGFERLYKKYLLNTA